MNKLLKYMLFIVLLFASGQAKADIEPINVVVKNVVASVEEAKKQYYDLAEQYNKIKSGLTTGWDKIKNVGTKIKDFTEDPVGVLKTVARGVLQFDDPNEAEFESVEKTKEAYGRVRGMKDNIAAQKELNKSINNENFKNMSVLTARAILKRQELKKEKTVEPDLSTLSAAQSATLEKRIMSAKRWNSILETQAYIHSFNYTTEVQNYQNEEEEI